MKRTVFVVLVLTLAGCGRRHAARAIEAFQRDLPCRSDEVTTDELEYAEAWVTQGCGASRDCSYGDDGEMHCSWPKSALKAIERLSLETACPAASIVPKAVQREHYMFRGSPRGEHELVTRLEACGKTFICRVTSDVECKAALDQIAPPVPPPDATGL